MKCLANSPLAVPIKGEGQPLVLPHKATLSEQVIHNVLMDGFRSLLIYPRIVLEGRPFALVPRKVLHGHDVRPPLEEMRHKSLPEDMVRDLLFDAKSHRHGRNQPMEAFARAAPRHSLPAGDEERRIFVVPTVKIPLEPV